MEAIIRCPHSAIIMDNESEPCMSMGMAGLAGVSVSVSVLTR